MTGSPAALVTGASAGIGLAIATALCADGYAVTPAARREPRVAAAADGLRAGGFDVHHVVADVAAPGAADELVAGHLERFGQLDVVVANAGWGNSGTVAEGSASDLERMLRVNVTGSFALAAAAMPTLR